MNIWRILLWKEFHEHKWKMLALTAIVLSVLIAGSIGNARDLFGLGAALYGYALIGPLYVAMGVSSGERSNRSMLHPPEALQGCSLEALCAAIGGAPFAR